VEWPDRIALPIENRQLTSHRYLIAGNSVPPGGRVTPLEPYNNRGRLGKEWQAVKQNLPYEAESLNACLMEGVLMDRFIGPGSVAFSP